MSYTKGTWTISDDHGKRWIETLANDDTICEIHRRNTRVGKGLDVEFHANAYLIASAPCLLEALEILVESNTQHSLVRVVDALKIARTAIAKAKGEVK